MNHNGSSSRLTQHEHITQANSKYELKLIDKRSENMIVGYKTMREDTFFYTFLKILIAVIIANLSHTEDKKKVEEVPTQSSHVLLRFI